MKSRLSRKTVALLLLLLLALAAMPVLMGPAFAGGSADCNNIQGGLINVNALQCSTFLNDVNVGVGVLSKILQF
jgi:hypothetical protein